MKKFVALLLSAVMVLSASPAVFAAPVKIGISKDDIIKAFDGYKTVFGRAESCILKGKKAIIQLIKNPVGAGEVLQTVADDKNAKILIIIKRLKIKGLLYAADYYGRTVEFNICRNLSGCTFLEKKNDSLYQRREP